jgi:prepilin-type N-terminal cleavage/methylation domain-containing protein
MIEITTSNSTKVNELLFDFGNLRSEVMVITMTTPALPPFHQKIFTHAKSAKVATDIHLTKNNPFRLYPESVGALRPLRAKARPGNAGREQSAFTLIELLAVITIIGILAGLTLGAAGAVRRHGATSTAKAEVAALQAACERYYADNNSYPTTNSMPDPSSTSDVNPSPTSKYPTAGKSLFNALFGTNQYNLPPSTKRYFEPKPAMVSSTTTANPYLIDPWGYAYGYNSDGTSAPLIWSTAGQTTSGGTNKWITSWPKM